LVDVGNGRCKTYGLSVDLGEQYQITVDDRPQFLNEAGKFLLVHRDVIAHGAHSLVDQMHHPGDLGIPIGYVGRPYLDAGSTPHNLCHTDDLGRQIGRVAR